MSGRISYFGGIVKDGLILYLDAAKNESYPGYGTTWTDITGNGYSGTLTNSPTFSNEKSGCVIFNGSNQHVDGVINGSIFTNDFTNSAWFYKLNNTEIWQGIFTNSTPATNNTYLMTFGNGSSSAPYNSVGVNQVGVLESGVFLDIGDHINKWLNVTITKSGSALKIYCYKDNILSQTGGTITWNGGNFSTTNGYQIGRHWAGGFIVPFQGYISIVQLYNRALTETEVIRNYNAVCNRFNLSPI